MNWLLTIVLLGAGAELAGIFLGVRELRDRTSRVRTFEQEKTPVGRSLGIAWSFDEALPVTPSGQTPEQRLTMLERRIEDLRTRLGNDMRQLNDRVSEHVDRRVGDAERALSARITSLREFAL